MAQTGSGQNGGEGLAYQGCYQAHGHPERKEGGLCSQEGLSEMRDSQIWMFGDSARVSLGKGIGLYACERALKGIEWWPSEVLRREECCERENGGEQRRDGRETAKTSI